MVSTKAYKTLTLTGIALGTALGLGSSTIAEHFYPINTPQAEVVLNLEQSLEGIEGLERKCSEHPELCTPVDSEALKESYRVSLNGLYKKFPGIENLHENNERLDGVLESAFLFLIYSITISIITRPKKYF